MQDKQWEAERWVQNRVFFAGRDVMQSMTGYGRSEVRSERLAFAIEARSVNHRYLDIALRYPPSYVALEPRMRRLVSSHFARGRIEVRIVQQNGSEGQRLLALDVALARQYYSALQQLQEALKLPGTIDLGMIVALRDILKVEEVPAEAEEAWELLAQGITEALQALKEMRQQEGAFLCRDLRARWRTITAHLEAIRQRVPVVVQEYRQRLQQRIKELLQEQEVDAERLSQEVVLFAERTDISEELTRLASHLQAFDRLLSSTQAVGRKLEFLVQEMHREVNTIGAKCNDAPIAQQVVEIKSELEKIREQVQNIE